jgi:drug/metabolite transporter (DMT)-like permease
VNPRRRIFLADAALLGVTAIWGVTFVVVKRALDDATPLLFNAVRLSLAAALLAAFYRPRWRRLPASLWLSSGALGACLATGYAFQTAGLTLTTPSKSAFITGLSVVLVPFLLALGWRRRLGAAVWAGSAMAAAGLYFLILAGAASRAGGSHRGDWLTLACAFAFALHIALLGEFAPRFGFRDIAVLQIGFAAAFSWLAMPAVENPSWHSSPALWMALAVTAVLATAVAFTTQTWAQQFTPASHTAVVFAAEPVFAWLAALWGFHERLEPVQLAGAGLILAAMIVVEYGRAT